MSNVSDLAERYARAAASDRANAITSACKIANQENRASELIASDLSLGDILQLLKRDVAAAAWAPHIAKVNAKIGL